MSETENKNRTPLHRYQREVLLMGEEALARLRRSTVALFGVGGVGSYAAEALARAGVGRIVLVDGDTVSFTNINRQLCALESTVGLPKVQVVAQRIRDIDPTTEVIPRMELMLPETADRFDFSSFDFVIDAIDTVSGKIAIAEGCVAAETPMIACMGTGNKWDPTAFVVTDLAKTSTCPLARVMRRELKKRGILHLPVVYSEEPASTPTQCVDPDSGRLLPGSLSFVPPVAGMIAAGEAIKALIKKEESSCE